MHVSSQLHLHRKAVEYPQKTNIILCSEWELKAEWKTER